MMLREQALVLFIARVVHLKSISIGAAAKIFFSIFSLPKILKPVKLLNRRKLSLAYLEAGSRLRRVALGSTKIK